jgi:ABC-type nitrate/sulfonate/bicarbonate transport system substrate-binding protein
VAHFTRRQFIGRSAALGALTLGGSSLLAACGDDSSSSSSSSGSKKYGKQGVQLDWIKNAQFAGSYMAVEKGYYVANGFESIDLLAGGPDIAVEPIVTQGKAKWAYTGSEFLAGAVAKGAKLKVIGTLFQNNPFGIMSLSSKPIKSPQDMIGKKIGVQAVNEGIWDALLKINKIDASKITKIPAQFDPAPLVNGEADGWFSFITNEPNVLRADGKEVTAFSLSDFGFKLYQQIVICTEDSFNKEKDLLAAGLRSEIQGWQYNIKNPDETAKLTVDKYGKDNQLNLKAVTGENNDQIKLMITTATTDKKGIFYMDAADIDANVATLKDLSLAIDKSVYSTEILDMVYKSGTDLLK